MPANQTRQRLLDAAQRLIENGGFATLTTKQIAREAGFAEGTLFKHFARKEDLVLAVLMENAPRFTGTISAKLPGQHSVKRNLEDIGLAALTFFAKLIPLGAMILTDAKLADRQRLTVTASNGGPRQVFELVTGYLAREQQLGRISERVAPVSAALALLGPCFHWAFFQQALGEPLMRMSDEEFVTGLVATLLKGLAPP
jgi:AcrR family transcriptional regulator